MAEHSFEDAANEFRSIVGKKNDEVSNEDKLTAYGWYKQATEGDNPKGPSGMFSFGAESAKSDAWCKNKGVSKEEAKKEYIKFVYEVAIPKYS
ncbi:704_t:CDS:2 [Acaulospora morrowiae]|uniref:704_t:CDS:1 n=1 Tax=Acaulospora morrowiae TaxID=94023 RepID=A0A9N9FPR3_9GLOM|nr:704_t:CDS:2 [Acaulospora morrowiae]